jgi:hypothetical protein
MHCAFLVKVRSKSFYTGYSSLVGVWYPVFYCISYPSSSLRGSSVFACWSPFYVVVFHQLFGVMFFYVVVLHQLFGVMFFDSPSPRRLKVRL